MWKDILIPGATAVVVSFIMFLSSKNSEKKDHGFVFNYYRLSYRRRLKRNFLSIPVIVIGLLIIFFLSNFPTMYRTMVITFFIVLFAIEILYNFRKWQKEQANS
ncbi:hypothetical protein [Oceanobacillus neutriphilus]|uniref:SdpI family protein n=1 Tax=Oceanobacillus neutriphilus TaxID=531815 RepID=A0ABQ2P0A3_9BACI|nr:hypothetical protein [Oceanobacillus neutriphilus]GGP14843.1 hypothetical protein GCM10011346_40470 [Oceanobacillus neutriphilus]